TCTNRFIFNTFQHYYSNCRYLFVIYFVLNVRAKTNRFEAVNDGRKSHRYEKKTVLNILSVVYNCTMSDNQVA
ncbi:hypothetical protein AB0854_26935, partial [Bacillus cereus]